jgi:hypothetical protein
MKTRTQIIIQDDEQLQAYLNKTIRIEKLTGPCDIGKAFIGIPVKVLKSKTDPDHCICFNKFNEPAEITKLAEREKLAAVNEFKHNREDLKKDMLAAVKKLKRKLNHDYYTIKRREKLRKQNAPFSRLTPCYPIVISI